VTVNRERVQLWVDALRSGDYKQIRGLLYGFCEMERCAWGVAFSVASESGWDGGLGHSHFLDAMIEWYGLPDDNAVREVMIWNDYEQASFFEIADRLYVKYLKDPE
jgi:hypothetical protein